MRRFRKDLPIASTAASGTLGRRDRGLCPLATWRTLPRGPIEPSRMLALSRVLAAIEILHEPRWRAAKAGDAAMSVAIAIDHLRRRSLGTRSADVVMSNLLVLAMRGDPTAPMVLAHALIALARLSPSHGTASLAASWLHDGGDRLGTIAARA